MINNDKRIIIKKECCPFPESIIFDRKPIMLFPWC